MRDTMENPPTRIPWGASLENLVRVTPPEEVYPEEDEYDEEEDEEDGPDGTRREESEDVVYGTDGRVRVRGGQRKLIIGDEYLVLRRSNVIGVRYIRCRLVQVLSASRVLVTLLEDDDPQATAPRCCGEQLKVATLALRCVRGGK